MFLAAGLVFPDVGSAAAQQQPRTLLVVTAHADDEVPVAPVLARYAREGVQVHLLIVTDGAQGGANTSIPRGAELARTRAGEAQCAAAALSLQPPILLNFPDGKLGDYTADPSRLYLVTARVAQEIERLHPDVVITWGPDGGTGHPDHRLVSAVTSQLVRAGAPGAPERLFYMYIPADGFHAMNPQRGAPPLLIPQDKYFTTRVTFSAEDFAAARQAMACHGTQYSAEVVDRVTEAQRRAWNGVIALVPAFGGAQSTSLFH